MRLRHWTQVCQYESGLTLESPLITFTQDLQIFSSVIIRAKGRKSVNKNLLKRNSLSFELAH